MPRVGEWLTASGILPKPEMAGLELQWAGVPASCLNIDASLQSGQSFRWRKDGDWLGVISDSAVRLRPAEHGFWWQTYPEPGRWELIQRYFALDVDLDKLYAEWLEREPRIGASLALFAGLRVLRQDADEAFFSFQCAACNTIVKITRTIRALELRLGEPICEIGGEWFHRFPTAKRIAEASEEDLRSDLWGYRAPRVIDLARHAAAQGPDWIDRMRYLPYREAHAGLMQLFGIGAKIADCVCLFGLGYDEAVPVDTHIRQIAVRLFRPDLAAKTLTPKVYWALGDLFRERFGCYAGWAQQYLFMHEINSK